MCGHTAVGGASISIDSTTRIGADSIHSGGWTGCDGMRFSLSTEATRRGARRPHSARWRRMRRWCQAAPHGRKHRADRDRADRLGRVARTPPRAGHGVRRAHLDGGRRPAAGVRGRSPPRRSICRSGQRPRRPAGGCRRPPPPPRSGSIRRRVGVARDRRRHDRRRLRRSRAGVRRPVGLDAARHRPGRRTARRRAGRVARPAGDRRRRAPAGRTLTDALAACRAGRRRRGRRPRRRGWSRRRQPRGPALPRRGGADRRRRRTRPGRGQPARSPRISPTAGSAPRPTWRSASAPRPTTQRRSFTAGPG